MNLNVSNIYFGNNLRKYNSSKGINSSRPSGCDTFVRAENKSISFGQIVGCTEVYNIKTKKAEKCLFAHNFTEQGGCLRLIRNDSEKIKELSQFFIKEPVLYKKLKENHFTFSENILNEISSKNPEIIKTINDLFIAEIVYSKMVHPDGIKKLDALKYKKINEEKDIVCIQNFRVYKNEYKYASRYLVIRLFKNILKDNPNIIIKAQAFGDNPKSPLAMYLRYGFIPLDTDVDELNRSKIKTEKGMRINPKKTAIMYLPKDALLYKLLAKI